MSRTLIIIFVHKVKVVAPQCLLRRRVIRNERQDDMRINRRMVGQIIHPPRVNALDPGLKSLKTLIFMDFKLINHEGMSRLSNTDRMVLDIAFFGYDLWKCESYTEMLTEPILRFAQTDTGVSTLASLRKHITTSEFINLMDSPMEVVEEEKKNISFFEFLTTRGLRISKVMSSLLQIAMGSAIFTSIGRKVLPEELRSVMSKITLSWSHEVSVISAIVDVLRNAYAGILRYLQGEDWTDAFVTDNTIVSWLYVYGKVEEQWRRVEHGVASITDLNEEVVDSLLDKARFIEADLNAKSVEITRGVKLLRIIKAKMEAIGKSRKIRVVPFCVFLHGPAGIGKSVLVNMLTSAAGAALKLDRSSDAGIYEKTPHTPFWEGVDKNVWGVVLDDAANLRVDRVTEDASISSLLDLINNRPFQPNMAFNQKGMTIAPKIVVGTTNVRELNFARFFDNAYAAARRVHLFVSMELADGKNVDENDDDKWVFKVHRAQVHNANEKRFTWEEIEKFESLTSFLRFYTENLLDHTAAQNKLVKLMTSMAQQNWCERVGGCGSFAYCTTEECIAVPPLVEELPHAEQELSATTTMDVPNMGDDGPNTTAENLFDQWYRGPNYQPLKTTYSYVWVWYLITCICSFYSFGLFGCISPYLGQIPAFFMSIYLGVVPSLYDMFKMQEATYINGWREVVAGQPLRVRVAFTAYMYYIALRRGVAYWVTPLLFRTRNREHNRRINKIMANLGSAVVIISGIATGYQMYRQCVKRFGKHEETQEEEAQETGASQTKANYWQVEKEKPIFNAVSNTSKGWKALHRNEIVPKLSPSVAHITVVLDGDDKAHHGVAFCVQGTLWATCNHVIPRHGDVKLELLNGQGSFSHINGKKAVYKQIELYRILAKDLVFFTVRSAPTVGFGKLFPLELPDTTTYRKIQPDVLVLSKDKIGSLAIARNTTELIHRVMDGAESGGLAPDVNCKVAEFVTNNSKFKQGWSGSPVLAQTGTSWYCLGITAYGKGIGNANPIMGVIKCIKADVDEAVDYFKFQPATFACAIEVGAVELGSAELVPKLTRLSHIPYLERGCVSLFGRREIDGKPVNKTCRSKLVPTPLQQSLLKQGFKQEFGPPIMRGYEPWACGLRALTSPRPRFPDMLINEAAQAYVDDVMCNLRDTFVHPLLSDVQCVLGVPGDPSMSSIDMSTSTGLPMSTVKSNVFSSLLEGGSPNEEVQALWDRTKDDIVSGRALRGPFCASLKDEARSLDNLGRPKKTRVFCAAPVFMVLEMRRWTLAMQSLIMRNNCAFECAVGINAKSEQWHMLYEHITRFGEENVLAGDFTDYDKSMDSHLIDAAFWVMHQILSRLEPTYDNPAAFRSIASAVSSPLVDYNGEMYHLNGVNPSGHSMTVVVNSIVNSLYMRMCFREYTKEPVSKFQQSVALMTYGDDNIMSIRDQRIPFSALQDTLGKYGVVYTDDEKRLDNVSFRSIWDCSFLKRKWVPCGDRCSVQLNLKSIRKSLMWQIPSAAVGSDFQTRQSVEAALDELSFHDSTVFDEYHRKIVIAVEDSDLNQDYFEKLLSRPQSYWRALYAVRNISEDPSDDVIEVRPMVDGQNQNIPVACSYCVAVDNPNKCGQAMKRARVFPKNRFHGRMERVPKVKNVAKRNRSTARNFIKRSTKNFNHAKSEKTKAKKLTRERDEKFSWNSFEWSSHEERSKNIEYYDEHEQSESRVQGMDITGGLTVGAKGLGPYLQRDVAIVTHTVPQNEAFSLTSWDIWQLWAENKAVSDKLRNFAFFRGDLAIKVMVNASSMIYGEYMLSYSPYVLGVEQYTTADGPDSIVPLSQRQHLMINPSRSAAGTMEFSFVFPYSHIKITEQSDWKNLGKLTLVQVSPFRPANTTALGDVTISIFAHAKPCVGDEELQIIGNTTDELAVPTSESTPLSVPGMAKLNSLKEKAGAARATFDEVQSVLTHDADGPVSSMIKQAAIDSNKAIDRSTWIGKIPLMRPAARLGAGIVKGLGSIVGFLGFTDRGGTDTVNGFKNLPFPNLSSDSTAGPIDVLKTQTNSEMCVDPRLAGGNGDDELSLASLVAHDSILTTFEWRDDQVPGTVLFKANVTPSMYAVRDTPAGGQVYMTPMAFASLPFEFWRGTLVFKFRIIASKYHQGRLLIYYDPLGDSLSSTAEPLPMVNAITVDIGPDKQTEYELAVPWRQGSDYRMMGTGTKQEFSIGSDGLIYDGNECNGRIEVRVLNGLTSPASNPIDIVTHVCAEPDMELTNPRDIPMNWSDYAPVSEVVTKDHTLVADTEKMYVDNVDNKDFALREKIYCGERILSLRQLLRKANYITTKSTTAADLVEGSGTYNEWFIHQLQPRSWGYDPQGLDEAESLGTPGINVPYNQVSNHLYGWVAPAYLGARGSMVYHFNGLLTENSPSWRITRFIEDALLPAIVRKGYYYTTPPASLVMSSELAYRNVSNRAAGATSQMVGNEKNQPGITVEVPFMSNTKFMSTRPSVRTLGAAVDGSWLNRFKVERCSYLDSRNADNAGIDVYQSIGRDFTFGRFVSAPRKYAYLGQGPV